LCCSSPASIKDISISAKRWLKRCLAWCTPSAINCASRSLSRR